MKMKIVSKKESFTILRRKDSRYAVLDSNKKPINGRDKVAILVEESLITAPVPIAEADTETIVDSSSLEDVSEEGEENQEAKSQADENDSDEGGVDTDA